MTKEEWFEQLAAKKAARGYSPDEVAAYLEDLRARYAHVTDEEFAAAHAAR